MRVNKGTLRKLTKNLAQGFFICQNKDFNEVESRVLTLSKKIMQALQILTNFGSFRKKVWTMTQKREKETT